MTALFWLLVALAFLIGAYGCYIDGARDAATATGSFVVLLLILAARSCVRTSKY